MCHRLCRDAQSGGRVMYDPLNISEVHATGMSPRYVNLLKPTGYVMHQQLTFNNCTFCPHCIYVFCIYLRTNSDLCHLQHKLTGFYHRNEKLLLRGTNWLFKQSSLRFVFKGLSNIALRIGKYRKKLLFYPPLERCICQFPLQTAPTLVRGV